MRQAGRYLPEYRETRKQAGSLPRSLLHAAACRGGDAAADPPLRLRCRDHVLRHPGHPACARPGRALRRERGTASSIRSRREPISTARRRAAPGASRARLRDARSPAVVPAEGDDAARLLRRALDGGELHDRRQGHARTRRRRALAAYRDPAFMRRAHRQAGRCLDRLSRSARSMRARKRCRFSRASASALPPALFDRLSLDPIRRIVDGPQGGAAAGARSSSSCGAAAPSPPFRGGRDRRRRWRSTGPSIRRSCCRPLPDTRATQGNLDPLALIAGGAAARDRASTTS